MLVDEFISDLRQILTDHVQHQPEYLLEVDGGPVGMKADIILATLYGFDEQVDAEWRIPKVEPVLRKMETPMFPVAEYVLQSNYASLQLDWLSLRDRLPSDVHPPAGDYMVTVALVRYRRRW